MIELFKPTFEWIKDDWRTDTHRVMLECLAWIISIGCSITMALTVPNPPLLFGLLVAGYMLGALILGNRLVCWLTTYC